MDTSSAESISAAIETCDEGTLRRLLQTVIRKVPECRRKIAEDVGLSTELYQVSEAERQKATADQYSEKVLSGKTGSLHASSDAVDFCERAKFVPMRLTYDERKYLRLIDATMHVSHYTDHMDTAQSVNANAARKLASGKLNEWRARLDESPQAAGRPHVASYSRSSQRSWRRENDYKVGGDPGDPGD
eukprot:symbB.v1.2.037978.t1/scaffold5766.1/size23849/2